MNESIAILEARGHPLVGSGLAVIGISSRDSGDTYAEGFLLLPTGEPSYRRQTSVFYRGHQLEPPHLEQLLMNRVRTWLQGELDAHLLAWQESHPAVRPVPPYSLHEIAEPAQARLSVLHIIGGESLGRMKQEARTRLLQQYVSSIFDISNLLETLK